MKKIYLLLLFIFFTNLLFSQKEAQNWIFGFSNWMNFETEPPIIQNTPDFFFFSERSSVSESDSEGNLLFYSDGFTVFNKDHLPMPNGFLNVDINLSDPVFTIPKPNSDSQFYLFFHANGFGSTVLEWRIVDLTLEGGNGDLIPDGGGFLLENPIGKITAVQHNNLQDIWIVSHENNSNSFQTWLVTETGIEETPVTSTIGNIYDPNDFESRFGQLKTSVNGNKIAIASQIHQNVQIFDFDKTTGVISNMISIDIPMPYGVEFSQNGRFLYVSHDGFESPQTIQQIDLWAGDASEIIASTTPVGTSPFLFGPAGGLQLAPNGTIISTNTFDFILGVINNPNELGLNCNYIPDGQELVGFSETLFGLPRFYHAYFQTPYFSHEGLCIGDNTSFFIDAFDNVVDSVFWEFGDPASGDNNVSTSLNPLHEFPGSGNYLVQLTLYSGNQIFQSSDIIHIAPTSLDLGPDYSVCSNELVRIDAFTHNATYLWSDGSTNSSIEVTSPGEFSVEVSVENCTILRDTISVAHSLAPTTDLGENGGLCNGEESVLDASSPGATYLWSTGATSPSITILFGGFYEVTVTNANGCSDSDGIFMQFDEVIVNPNQANIACHGDSNGVAVVFPVSGQLPLSFVWDDGDTLYTNNNLAPGDYSVTVTDALGCTVVQEFTLTQPDEIIVELTVNSDDPNTPNPDGIIILEPTGGKPPFTYDWENFGETTDAFKTGLSAGEYNITITDDNDCEKIVTAIIDGVTSTEDHLLEKIQVFPNPVNELLYFKLPFLLDDDLEVSFSNVLGQKVSENFFLKKGISDFSIDVTDWAVGIYFLKIKLREEEKIWKINVQ